MSVKVNFAASDAGFTSTVKKVNDSMKGMDDGVKNAASSVKTSFGAMVKAGAVLTIGFGAIKMAAAAIGSTFDQFGKALAMGGEMDDLSTRTGETVANLAVLQNAFEFTGVGADKVGGTINKLQKFMDDAAQGSTKNNEVLGRLGLTMEDMAGKTPTQQMELLADRLQSVSDDGEASALAMSIFGKAGGELLPILKNFSSELGDAKDRLGSMPDVMQESAQAFARIEDNIATGKNKFMEFAAGLLNEVSPAVELVTKLLSNFDAAGAGMKLGEIITGASNAMGGFSDALSAIKLGEFMLAFKITFESIKLQAADSINSIAANVMAAVEASGTFLLTAFGPGSGIFTIISSQFDILSAKFTRAMIEGVKAIATVLANMFDTPLIDAARKINPILDSVLDGIEGISTGFDGAIKNIDTGISNSQNKIKNSTEQIAGDFMLAGQEAGKTFDQALSSSKQLIDTSAISLELKKHQGELDVLEAEARSKAAKAAAEKLTIEEEQIRITQNRLNHEERIKELDADIVSAKRQGNAEELAHLEALKAYHIELEASKEKGLNINDAITNAQKASAGVMDEHIKKTKEKLKNEEDLTEELQKQLGLGAQIIANANAAQSKNRLDPGGRLEKAAGEAIGEGNFAAARRIGRQIEKREEYQAIKEAFGAYSSPSLREMAKDQGIDTLGKKASEIRKELADKAKKRQGEMVPGKGGKPGEGPGQPKPAADDPMAAIRKAVDAIQKLVEKIEPKLPTAALGV